MNRLAVLIAFLAASAVQPCLAEDPAFCKSMCTSEQRACHARAQLQPREELQVASQPERNPFARTAQGEVESPASHALGASGATNRRLARGSACDTGYQQCTRSCDKPQNAGDGGQAQHRPIKFG